MKNLIYLFQLILSSALFVIAEECNFERDQERIDQQCDQKKSSRLWVPHPGGIRSYKEGKIIEGMSL